MTKNKTVNIIKTINDHKLIYIDEERSIQNYNDCNWGLNKEEKITNLILRKRIEPWLTALFQSEHLSLLCGSGLTTAITLKVGHQATTMQQQNFGSFNETINEYAKVIANKNNRGDGNIEDQIRTSFDLLTGLKILNIKSDNDEQIKELEDKIKENLNKFAKSILQTEHNIASISDVEKDQYNEAYSILVNFLLSFASRAGNKDRLNIFTTNYDRLIEFGAELAGIHLIDRFVGTIMPVFRSSRLNLDMHYNPPGVRGEPRYLEGVVRFSKLHGSIDWVQNNNEIRRIGLPFGSDNIDPYLEAPGLYNVDALKLMIYPNSSKDRETAEYPYVELFRDFASSICRPNSTLVTYGYGFGDEHINRVINDMLTIPSTHLVIISYDDPIGRILDFYNKSNRYSQISILIGPNLGDITELVNYYLPKSAIDLNSIKMNDILRNRMEYKVNP